MRLEDMKDTFPKMPEDIKNMIEKEVAVQIKSRQEESMDPKNGRECEDNKIQKEKERHSPPYAGCFHGCSLSTCNNSLCGRSLSDA